MAPDFVFKSAEPYVSKGMKKKNNNNKRTSRRKTFFVYIFYVDFNFFSQWIALVKWMTNVLKVIFFCILCKFPKYIQILNGSKKKGGSEWRGKYMRMTCTRFEKNLHNFPLWMRTSGCVVYDSPARYKNTCSLHEVKFVCIWAKKSLCLWYFFMVVKRQNG